MKKTAVKTSLILVVALLMCATVIFAACTPASFTPVTAPASASVDPDDNGGLAVKYGEWLYYINGYTSDTSAVNSYTDDVKETPRVGSVVRIKLAELEHLFEIYDEDNKTTSEKNDEIADYVRQKAETVVPRFYYSGNTTTTQFTGLYIFNDRLYITTPNDQLTAGGDKLTGQLVLMSYKLDGSDEQSHFVFTDNAAQIAYATVEGKLMATYLTDSKLYCLDVAAGSSKEVVVKGEDKADGIDNVYSSPVWDQAGKCVFFLDKTNSVCKLELGSSEYEIIVENPDFEMHTGDDPHVESPEYTYTINSVNNGQVYYTRSNSAKIYWASSADNKDNVACNTNNVSGAIGWKNGKIVYSMKLSGVQLSVYGLYVNSSADGSKEGRREILSPRYNSSAITINKIVGDVLYYSTGSGVNYKLDLNATTEQGKGTSYGNNPSATGWAAADFVDYATSADPASVIHYVITASSSGLSIAKFDPATEKTGTSVSLLLTAKTAD